jgi:ATP adenylyltransferase
MCPSQLVSVSTPLLVARILDLTSGIDAVWSAYWAIFYRKFFWDFVGGVVRDPGGVQ